MPRRVRGRMDLPEPANRHVRVNLRARQIRVSQQHLDISHVRAVIQHVRRARMAQRVTRTLRDARTPHVPCHDPAQCPTRLRAACATAVSIAPLHRSLGVRRERYDAGFFIPCEVRLCTIHRLIGAQACAACFSEVLLIPR